MSCYRFPWVVSFGRIAQHDLQYFQTHISLFSYDSRHKHQMQDIRNQNNTAHIYKNWSSVAKVTPVFRNFVALFTTVITNNHKGIAFGSTQITLHTVFILFAVTTSNVMKCIIWYRTYVMIICIPLWQTSYGAHARSLSAKPCKVQTVNEAMRPYMIRNNESSTFLNCKRRSSK
jgi:hypothetical protein